MNVREEIRNVQERNQQAQLIIQQRCEVLVTKDELKGKIRKKKKKKKTQDIRTPEEIRNVK